MSKKEKDIKKSKLSGTDLNEVAGGTSRSPDAFREIPVNMLAYAAPIKWKSKPDKSISHDDASPKKSPSKPATPNPYMTGFDPR